MAEFPKPREGIVLTHFIVSEDVEPRPGVSVRRATSRRLGARRRGGLRLARLHPLVFPVRPRAPRWREVEATRLGILDSNGTPAGMIGYEGDTVLPTLVVTDSEGRIVFADQTDNYRVRPTPDTVLAALGDCGSGSGAYGAAAGESERSGSSQAGGTPITERPM